MTRLAITILAVSFSLDAFAEPIEQTGFMLKINVGTADRTIVLGTFHDREFRRDERVLVRLRAEPSTPKREFSFEELYADHPVLVTVCFAAAIIWVVEATRGDPGGEKIGVHAAE